MVILDADDVGLVVDLLDRFETLLRLGDLTLEQLAHLIRGGGTADADEARGLAEVVAEAADRLRRNL